MSGLTHFKMTAEQVPQIAGDYGQYRIEPRLALDTFYYLPTACVNVPGLSQEQVAFLQGLPVVDVQSSDFPQININEL